MFCLAGAYAVGGFFNQNASECGTLQLPVVRVFQSLRGEWEKQPVRRVAAELVCVAYQRRWRWGLAFEIAAFQ